MPMPHERPPIRWHAARGFLSGVETALPWSPVLRFKQSRTDLGMVAWFLLLSVASTAPPPLRFAKCKARNEIKPKVRCACCGRVRIAQLDLTVIYLSLRFLLGAEPFSISTRRDPCVP